MALLKSRVIVKVNTS